MTGIEILLRGDDKMTFFLLHLSLHPPIRSSYILHSYTAAATTGEMEGGARMLFSLQRPRKITAHKKEEKKYSKAGCRNSSFKISSSSTSLFISLLNRKHKQNAKIPVYRFSLLQLNEVSSSSS